MERTAPLFETPQAPRGTEQKVIQARRLLGVLDVEIQNFTAYARELIRLSRRRTLPARVPKQTIRAARFRKRMLLRFRGAVHFQLNEWERTWLQAKAPNR